MAGAAEMDGPGREADCILEKLRGQPSSSYGIKTSLTRLRPDFFLVAGFNLKPNRALDASALLRFGTSPVNEALQETPKLEPAQTTNVVNFMEP
jgi:hypothetical protein